LRLLGRPRVFVVVLRSSRVARTDDDDVARRTRAQPTTSCLGLDQGIRAAFPHSGAWAGRTANIIAVAECERGSGGSAARNLPRFSRRRNPKSDTETLRRRAAVSMMIPRRRRTDRRALARHRLRRLLGAGDPRRRARGVALNARQDCRRRIDVAAQVSAARTGMRVERVKDGERSGRTAMGEWRRGPRVACGGANRADFLQHLSGSPRSPRNTSSVSARARADRHAQGPRPARAGKTRRSWAAAHHSPAPRDGVLSRNLSRVWIDLRLLRPMSRGADW